MTRRRSSPAGPRPGGLGTAARRFRELPPWIQGWTAVVGVLIAGLGLGLTAIQVFGERGPGPTPVVLKPQAFIEEVLISAGAVEAHGGFRAVDVEAEVILLIGRPTGATDERWLPVEANVTPAGEGERVDGTWDAVRPFSDGGRFAWRVLVVPATSGVTDGYEDIRRNGPDSELVLAASEEFVTGE